MQLTCTCKTSGHRHSLEDWQFLLSGNLAPLESMVQTEHSRYSLARLAHLHSVHLASLERTALYAVLAEARTMQAAVCPGKTTTITQAADSTRAPHRAGGANAGFCGALLRRRHLGGASPRCLGSVGRLGGTRCHACKGTDRRPVKPASSLCLASEVVQPCVAHK